MPEAEVQKRKPGRPKKAPQIAPVGMNFEEPKEGGPKDNKRGFSGKCIKINIYRQDGVHDNADQYVPLSLGEYPLVWVPRGYNWIVPVEAYSVLADTAVDTQEMEALKYPNSKGEWWEVRNVVKNRFPHQVFGEATWEEYEAHRKRLLSEGKIVSAF